MKGDFTRMTFDPQKHYRGVLMQQGRVQLDADWNEQIDIQAHRDETEARDVIGACGTSMDPQGVTLIVDANGLSAAEKTRLTEAKLLPLKPGDFLIGPGRYYVDGILIENEDWVVYTQQPDYPGDDANKAPSQPTLEINPIAIKGFYLAYLDVWTRHITALDDDHIREKALGGPDTTTRAKTVWQVKIKKLDSDKLNCATAPLPGDESTGRLCARSKPVDEKNTPCEVPPGAGYSRLENQLYRVEIHTGGKETDATFKWSRDNASMATVWKSKDGKDLMVGSSGPDDVLGFAPNQWIELSDDTRELQGQPGTLVRLVTVVGQKLTIDPATATGPTELTYFPLNPKVRRWDTIATAGGTRKINNADTADGFIRLEDGVEIAFEKGEYRTGDYWLIPARTATADVEWPKDANGDPVPQAKHSIYHHTCPLGLLSSDGTNLLLKEDCRPFFPALTDLKAMYYVSGDGQEADPNKTLPYDLVVGVSNGRHAVKGAAVQFVVTGGGTVSVTIPYTDAQGLARCRWTLGGSGPQQVTAILRDDSGQAVHLPVIFNAQFARKGEGEEPGIRVENIQFINGPAFHNDTAFSADQLVPGLAIICTPKNQGVDQLSVRSRSTGVTGISPTVFVTLDLPYPSNAAERELWGNEVVAFKPIILAADVKGDNNVIYWSPAKMTQAWLVNRLFAIMKEFKLGQRILAHLTLKGNFIWAEKSKDLYLDGDVFGGEGKDPAGVPFIDGKLPSGNQRRGGDLEMWFWLVAPQKLKRVVLLGNPNMAVFKALSATRKGGLSDAFGLALDRTALRDVIPPEFDVDVAMPFDRAKAKELAVRHELQGIRFITWAATPLFRTDELISEMVAVLEISMGPKQVDGLMDKLQAALESGGAPEAVLVDTALTHQLNQWGYTDEIVTL